MIWNKWEILDFYIHGVGENANNWTDNRVVVAIAVPNRVMMGHCQIYTCAFDLGLGDMRNALETAVRIGNQVWVSGTTATGSDGHFRSFK